MAGQVTVSSEIKDLFQETTTATICTQLFKRGLLNQFIQGVQLVTPKATMMVGEAYTPASSMVASIRSAGRSRNVRRERC